MWTAHPPKPFCGTSATASIRVSPAVTGVRAKTWTTGTFISTLFICMHHWCPLMMGHVVSAQRARNGSIWDRFEALHDTIVPLCLCEELLCHARPQIGALPLPALTIWMQIMPVYIYFTLHVCNYNSLSQCTYLPTIYYHICTVLVFSTPDLHSTPADSGDLWTLQ